jgi:hypothetical protein
MSLPTALFGRWLHAHEEDEGDVEVYRPADAEFPLSRGRRGFELRRDGTFVHVGIARGDGNVDVPGRWERLEEDRLRVTLDDGRTYTLELVSADPREVRLRRS